MPIRHNIMIEVSVIMPAYNAMKYLSESIESVIQQTFKNWELIIIDDGSTDETREIAGRYVKKDERVKYLYQQNGKQGKARNYGLKHAKGKYIAFLDSDDLWLPMKLECQLREMAEHNVDLVFSDAHVFKVLPLDPHQKMNTITGYLSGNEAITKMLEINRVPILTVLVKRDAVDKVNKFSEKMEIQNNEDYHLWLKLLIEGFIFYASPQVYSAYRDHEESVTSGNKLSIRESIETLHDIAEKYPKYKRIVKPYLKIWFNRYLYTKNNWNGKAYKELIKMNCIYLDKKAWILWFSTLYQMLGLKISRKAIAVTINK